MPRTPDRFPGPLDEEEVLLEIQTEDPEDEGAMRNVNGAFRFKDSIGVFDPRSAGNPFEFSFSVKPTVLINHMRGQRPIVQVVLPIAPPMGWNLGGWNEPNTPWNVGGSAIEERLPDDQYTLRHLSDDRFLVLFGTARTGRVIYF